MHCFVETTVASADLEVVCRALGKSYKQSVKAVVGSRPHVYSAWLPHPFPSIISIQHSSLLLLQHCNRLRHSALSANLNAALQLPTALQDCAC